MARTGASVGKTLAKRTDREGVNKAGIGKICGNENLPNESRRHRQRLCVVVRRTTRSFDLGRGRDTGMSLPRLPKRGVKRQCTGPLLPHCVPVISSSSFHVVPLIFSELRSFSIRSALAFGVPSCRANSNPSRSEICSSGADAQGQPGSTNNGRQNIRSTSARPHLSGAHSSLKTWVAFFDPTRKTQ